MKENISRQGNLLCYLAPAGRLIKIDFSYENKNRLNDEGEGYIGAVANPSKTANLGYDIQ